MSTPEQTTSTAVSTSYDNVEQVVTTVVKETKEGYKTTEFWFSVVAALATVTGTVPVPHDAKGAILAGVAVLYALSRGLAKKGVAAGATSTSVVPA